MRYLSVASGIEAATVAWEPLGFEPVGFSEIEPFPCAVLRHYYHDVANYGDMTGYKEWDIESADIVVGGTPCQSFSVAGLRGGLDDPRGNLALVYLGIVERFRPTWAVWENVPGVLSSGGGRDFGAFLGGLARLGYGFAYRVLDAQYFGVPQRRRRVFVVGHARDWRCAAAVLFDSACMSRDTPARRETGERVAPTIAARTRGGGGLGTDFDCDGGLIPFDATQITSPDNRYNPQVGDPMHPLARNAHPPAIAHVAFNARQDPVQHATVDTDPYTNAVAYDAQNCRLTGSKTGTLQTMSPSGFGQDNGHGIFDGMSVRRITPREAERLQGFPDDYTLIEYRGKPAADGPRYKALGNSMAVPVMRWIGERIQNVEAAHG